MIPDEEDIQRRINAETSLAHLKDQEKLITARESEAKRLLEPIRKRKITNHYMEEARDLLERRLSRGS